jgi:Ca2+-binding RTX toxin-like protein
MLEAIEPRRLFSVTTPTVNLTNGTLSVVGTDFSETLYVHVDPMNSSMVLVERTGVVLRSFARNSISQITMSGLAGDDHLTVDHGLPACVLHGDGDTDLLDGGDGNDQLFGDAGDDHLKGHAGNDLLDGGTGADRFDGGAGADFDTVTYESRTAPISATFDSPTPFFGGNDGEAGEGDDIENNVECVRGGSAGDTIVSTTSDTVARSFYGNGGADRITGGNGNDIVYGGIGDDVIDGGDGNDKLYGDLGADNIRGGRGDDLLDGVDWWMIGQTHHDHDIMDGGEGTDTAWYGIRYFSTVEDTISNCEIFHGVRDYYYDHFGFGSGF